MRTLEVRRHSLRVIPGQYLSQAGVSLARRLGSRLGPFNRVVTSPLPRAYETALAMGFAVDEQVEALSVMPAEVDAEIQWDAGFAAWAQVIKGGGAAAKFAHAQAEVWRAIMRALPDEGRALVITHGGIVEAGALGSLPPDTPIAWTSFCRYCEGVRLTFDGDDVVNAERLQVEQ